MKKETTIRSLAGATGTLTLRGVENLVDGSFVEDVSGVVCVDLSP
jgi:hypothetical protein